MSSKKTNPFRVAQLVGNIEVNQTVWIAKTSILVHENQYYLLKDGHCYPMKIDSYCISATKQESGYIYIEYPDFDFDSNEVFAHTVHKPSIGTYLGPFDCSKNMIYDCKNRETKLTYLSVKERLLKSYDDGDLQKVDDYTDLLLKMHKDEIDKDFEWYYDMCRDLPGNLLIMDVLRDEASKRLDKYFATTRFKDSVIYLNHLMEDKEIDFYRRAIDSISPQINIYYSKEVKSIYGAKKMLERSEISIEKIEDSLKDILDNDHEMNALQLKLFKDLILPALKKQIVKLISSINDYKTISLDSLEIAKEFALEKQEYGKVKLITDEINLR